jgi:hypothetical protein
MTQALVPVDPKKRSVVTFPMTGDPWPTVAAWAKQHKFLPREPQTGDTKLFQKGSGLFTAPMRAQFTLQAGTMHLEAWIHIPLFSRIMALFMLPAEMNMQSGGFRAVLPRNIGRKAVNELLAQVHAPLIP